MSKKLTGMLNLSKIPKELIKKNKNGEAIVWVDLMANTKGADQFGNTHTITIYDKENRKSIYIANLKPQEIPEKATQQTSPQVPPQAGGHDQEMGDLPF